MAATKPIHRRFLQAVGLLVAGGLLFIVGLIIGVIALWYIVAEPYKATVAIQAVTIQGLKSERSELQRLLEAQKKSAARSSEALTAIEAKLAEVRQENANLEFENSKLDLKLELAYQLARIRYYNGHFDSCAMAVKFTPEGKEPPDCPAWVDKLIELKMYQYSLTHPVEEWKPMEQRLRDGDGVTSEPKPPHVDGEG